MNDEKRVFDLYRKVAAIPGGLARIESEITPSYVHHNLTNALSTGICLLATNEHREVVGEIHAYRLTPKVFQHVLSELTIAIDPDFQGQGVGKRLFTAFLDHVSHSLPQVYRVELIARESNEKAIQFYQKLGFEIEGKLKGRIFNHHNTLEADVMMAWFNPYYLGVGQ
mgnify:CR=1 FL=1